MIGALPKGSCFNWSYACDVTRLSVLPLLEYGIIWILTYRPDIDGLRAIAVVSVVLCHLDRRFLPGGFVGVDVFFVISGYLITSVLCHAYTGSRLNLLAFYQHRIARLLPAAVTVALVTLAGAAFVYGSEDYAKAGAALVAVSLFVANVKFMLQDGYFAQARDAHPFLHYWTLSAEEQFYIFYPALLFFLLVGARKRAHVIIAAVGVCSLVACLLLSQVNPVWAFFLLPTRAWELCAGAVVALAPFVTRQQIAAPGWLSTGGLLLIAISMLVIHEGPAVPGWALVMPVAGAVAIVVPRVGPSYVDKLLSFGPIVGIGKMSYSLYLWHWPVFSLVDYRFLMWSGASRVWLKIAMSGLLAFLSFRLLEAPARTYLKKPWNLRMAYLFLLATVVVCVPLGIAVRKYNYVNAELGDVTEGGIVYSGRPEAPSVLLMGDSHGSMYGKLLRDICAELGRPLTVISVAGRDALPMRDVANPLWLSSLAVVRKNYPDYLVLGSYWIDRIGDGPERLTAALDALKPHVGRVILLGQPPILPTRATRTAIRHGARPPFREGASDKDLRRAVNERVRRFKI